MDLKTNYISLAEKKIIIDQIAQYAISEENGMKFINYTDREISLVISLLNYYTDINVEEADIDSLYADGTIADLKESIPQSELEFIEKGADFQLKQIVDTHNSVAGVLNRNLESVIKKIPDEKGIKRIIAYIPKHINKIENKEVIIDMVKSAISGVKDKVSQQPTIVK